jgi:hypothetical protein
MKNVLDQLKQYWFLIVFIFGGVAAIVKVLGNSYVIEVADSNLKGDAAKQYITELIQHELEKASAIAALNGRLETHDAKIESNADDIQLTQSQLQDVARILMQPPNP